MKCTQNCLTPTIPVGKLASYAILQTAPTHYTYYLFEYFFKQNSSCYAVCSYKIMSVYLLQNTDNLDIYFIKLFNCV